MLAELDEGTNSVGADDDGVSVWFKIDALMVGWKGGCD
jgi:hypothetical protein